MWQRLLTDMMLGLLLPALAGLIALARLLWIGVASGLKSLERLAHDLKSGSSASLAAITLSQHTIRAVPRSEGGERTADVA